MMLTLSSSGHLLWAAMVPRSHLHMSYLYFQSIFYALWRYRCCFVIQFPLQSSARLVLMNFVLSATKITATKITETLTLAVSQRQSFRAFSNVKVSLIFVDLPAPFLCCTDMSNPQKKLLCQRYTDALDTCTPFPLCVFSYSFFFSTDGHLMLQLHAQNSKF